MMLPSNLREQNEWTFVGPMGPALPDKLKHLPIIAVDGGAHFHSKLDIWVGDADSYEKEVVAGHIYRHPVEKDQSDLALALSLFKEPRHFKFHFWGFLGGRKDHELFNLGEALTFLDEQLECQIMFYDENGKILFHVLGSGHWKFSYDGLFSLGTLKKTMVRLRGECAYPIEKYQLLNPLSSLGLSNIGKGEMILENDGPVFLYYPEGK
jgi:thiamine pyrophosphokinase